jgi:hypothetical protein
MEVPLSFNNTLSTAGERIYNAHGKYIYGSGVSGTLARILVETSIIMIKVIHDFPKSFDTNAENVPQIRPRPLLSMSF